MQEGLEKFVFEIAGWFWKVMPGGVSLQLRGGLRKFVFEIAGWV